MRHQFQARPDAIVVLDPGSSLSKIVVGLANDYRPFPLLMEPEVIELPYASVLAYQEQRLHLSALKPEREAWLELTKPATSERRVTIVGTMAQRLDALARLEQLKYETALYKVLAAVGSISQIHADRLSSKFAIDLAILLPYSEYANRHQLAQQVEQGLRHFYFRGQSLRVRLNRLRIFPEGAGLMTWQLLHYPSTPQHLAILMLGHRNTSLLVFKQESLQQGLTLNYGFHWLLTQVCQRTAGQTPQHLAAAVYQMKGNIQADAPLLLSCLRSTRPDNRPVEAAQLATAIRTARAEYWQHLSQWLALNLPPNLDAVWMAGGAVLYLYDEFLRPYFAQSQLLWGQDLLAAVEADLQLSERGIPAADVTAFRCLDAYSIYRYLQHLNQPQRRVTYV